MRLIRHRTIQWIKRQFKIIGQCTQQRRIAPCAIPPWHPRQSNREVPFQSLNGGLPEHMQAIANLRFFQLTQVGIKLGQITILVTRKARVLCKAGYIRQ